MIINNIVSRAKMLGGTSCVNGMLYLRGQPEDYNAWARQGIEGWSFDDVLPFFLKSEDQRNPYLAQNTQFHRTRGPQPISSLPFSTKLASAFLEAADWLGFPVSSDLNSFRHGENTDGGFARVQVTGKDGQRYSTARAFLKPVVTWPNLDVLTLAQVLKVYIKDGRALGVQYSRHGIKRNVWCRKEVILSAGVVGSPQLLMLSGVGPARHLR